MSAENLISIGDYIVIQKQKYFKLHQLNSRCEVTLGKDKVDLRTVVGQPFWTTFKMVPKNKKEFSLEIAGSAENLTEAVMKEANCGHDNRNITDDGKSQLLSTEEIVAFRDNGLSAQNIVEKLIESSTTFWNKTEYSQEKYLKKKERKYFEFIVVRKPTIRLLAQIFYCKDPFSVLGLRQDSIAQILSFANIQSQGLYVLFESGTQALLGAAILECLVSDGGLINITTGKFPPKQAILGMNFPEDKTKNCLTVRLNDFLNKLDDIKVGNTEVDKYSCPASSDLGKNGCAHNEVTIDSKVVEEITKIEDVESNDTSEEVKSLPSSTETSDDIGNKCATNKRKQDDPDGNEMPIKRPRWLETLDKAADLLSNSRADGLILACKEYPVKIVQKLLDYLKPSRQIIIYSVYREPLVQLFVELKRTRKDIIGLHLYENWLRSHQILTDRTHPDVTMSASGGHILVGTKVEAP